MGLFKRKGSKNQNGGQQFDVWWYEFNFQGARFRESAHTANRTVAERIMREHRRRLEEGAGGIKAVTKPKTFAVASKEWLEEKKATWSKSNHRIESTNVSHLLPHFGKKLLADISGADVSRYQAIRKDKDASPKTINLEVAALRAVLRRARLWAHIQPDVTMLKAREDVGRALSEDEKNILLAACKASRSRALYPAFMLSLHTGVRSVELRSLQWQNVDLIERTIRVGRSKTQGGEGRVIPLSDAAYGVVREWRTQFPGAKPLHYVFPSERYGLKGEDGRKDGKVMPYAIDPTKPISSFKTAWTRARETAGVQCRWHDARHSFVSDLAEGAASDTTIMAMAGHLSKKMMERYSHTRNERKREAIAAAFNKKKAAAVRREREMTTSESASPHFSPHSEVPETAKVM